MKVVSISNIKGGVGKTTTAVVLAVGLIERGYRVLLIDSGSQTNLTMCFLREHPDGLPSLYHIYSAREAVDDVKVAVKDNLDLVVGDFGLCNADIQFTKAGRLKKWTWTRFFKPGPSWLLLTNWLIPMWKGAAIARDGKT